MQNFMEKYIMMAIIIILKNLFQNVVMTNLSKFKWDIL